MTSISAGRLGFLVRRGGSRKAAVWSVWLLSMVVAVMNVLLIKENSALRAVSRPPTAVADRITELSGIGLDGRVFSVPFEPGRRYLVFTFSGGCGYCKSSARGWQTIQSQLDLSTWTVVWVSQDSRGQLKDFADEADLQGLVLTDVPYRTYRQLGLAAVPQSIVLSDDGRVLGSVGGELTGPRVAQVLDLVGRAGPLRGER